MEEILKKWKEYNEKCKKDETEYFNYVMERFGPMMYVKNKNNIPTFEGFMDFLTTPETNKGLEDNK